MHPTVIPLSSSISLSIVGVCLLTHLSAGLQTCGDRDQDHLIYCSILSIVLTQRRGLNKYFLMDKYKYVGTYKLCFRYLCSTEKYLTNSSWNIKRKLPVKSLCIIFMTLRIPMYPPNPRQPVAFTQTSDLSPDSGLFTMWKALLKIFQEGKPLLIHGFIHSLKKHLLKVYCIQNTRNTDLIKIHNC